MTCKHATCIHHVTVCCANMTCKHTTFTQHAMQTCAVHTTANTQPAYIMLHHVLYKHATYMQHGPCAVQTMYKLTTYDLQCTTYYRQVQATHRASSAAPRQETGPKGPSPMLTSCTRDHPRVAVNGQKVQTSFLTGRQEYEVLSSRAPAGSSLPGSRTPETVEDGGRKRRPN